MLEVRGGGYWTVGDCCGRVILYRFDEPRLAELGDENMTDG